VSAVAIPNPPVWTGALPLPVFPKPRFSRSIWRFIVWGSAIAVGMFVLLVIIGNLVPSAPNHSSASGPSAQQTISVSAQKLWMDYHANEVAADNQYKGNRLVVQGQVESINKDFTDGVYVSFWAPNKFEPVNAYIESDYQAQAAGLQIGQIITVDCKGGGMLVGSPVLKGCSIEPDVPAGQNSPEPQPNPNRDSNRHQTIPLPSQRDAMQPFTSAYARFSVLFPGTPTKSSQPVQLKNGETVTLYVFSVTAENGNTGYAVKYINYPADYMNGYPADYAISDPQVRLQAAEKGDATGKTLFRDQAIDLDGVPGRDYAIMLPDGSSCTVHEYLAGNRLYQLLAWTAKDYLPNDQGYQFLHSFRIQ
jgi:hypothetical protein